MKPWREALTVACWMLLAAGKASALDCGRAATPIESAVCRDATLAHLDAELNDLYNGLRPQLTPKARGELLTEQRAWLAERNRVCARADAACLQKAYGERLEQLEAVNAAARAKDGKLDDLHPLVVQGSWKATAIQDRGGQGRTNAGDVRKSLSREDLPALGEPVNAAPGKVCLGQGDCRTMAWKRTTLARVEGGDVIAPAVGLSPTAQVLVGNSGAKESPLLLLVPRDGGKMWAIFGLCDANGMNCRNAVEEWTPLGAATGPQPGR